VAIEASGRDIRSAGTASATVIATLVSDDDTTRAEVVTDLTVTGRPAQFGRGMISQVGENLIGQFADCLADTLTGPASAAAPAAGPERPPGTEVASAPPAAVPAPKPSPGAVAAPAEEPEAADVAEPDRPAEPIDLLRLTADTATVRRLAGYGLAALILVMLWWLLRRGRSGGEHAGGGARSK
jgi:uncharacterized protein